jgi:hypothetical protein
MRRSQTANKNRIKIGKAKQGYEKAYAKNVKRSE